MTSLIMLLLIFVSISLVYCENNTALTSQNTTLGTPTLNKTTIQASTSLVSNNTLVLVPTSSSVIKASLNTSSALAPNAETTSSSKKNAIVVVCGNNTCSMYEECNATSNKCYCPSSASLHKDEPVCGSDGHVYKNYGELKMKACKHKSNVTKADKDYCKSRHKKSSNKKTITIIVIISLLLILVLVIVVILFLKKRREALSISEPKKDKSKDALL
ncbi:uncharacterized protein LOC101234971 isoform X3 [Hydra vulgaris]|uniref:Uncharacterized protein LOC101234971 isoform X3 n=1 Tax=Hydra vulgaris TaxID=6087 RepID=A0ABM4CDZ9_HYDVU